MQLSRNTTTYLILAQAAALGFGYILRSPDLSATAQHQDAIRKQTQQEAFEYQQALNRAQTCIPLMSEVPITDGASAYFSSVVKGRVVIHKNRPMPSGTTVCDSFGNTGVIVTDFEGNPIVSDIRQMPFEEMEKILTQRGVRQPQTPHRLLNK